MIFTRLFIGPLNFYPGIDETVGWFGHVARAGYIFEGKRTVVGQCKGMDRAETDCDVERARIQRDPEKACQSCCPNGLNSL